MALQLRGDVSVSQSNRWGRSEWYALRTDAANIYLHHCEGVFDGDITSHAGQPALIATIPTEQLWAWLQEFQVKNHIDFVLPSRPQAGAAGPCKH